MYGHTHSFSAHIHAHIHSNQQSNCLEYVFSIWIRCAAYICGCMRVVCECGYAVRRYAVRAFTLSLLSHTWSTHNNNNKITLCSLPRYKLPIRNFSYVCEALVWFFSITLTFLTVTHNQRAKRRLIRVVRFCFQVYMDVCSFHFFFLPSHIHSFCSAVLVSCKIYHQMHAEVTKLTKQSQNLHYARFERIEMNMNTILIRSVIVCFRYQMNWIVSLFFNVWFEIPATTKSAVWTTRSLLNKVTSYIEQRQSCAGFFRRSKKKKTICPMKYSLKSK